MGEERNGFFPLEAKYTSGCSIIGVLATFTIEVNTSFGGSNKNYVENRDPNFYESFLMTADSKVIGDRAIAIASQINNGLEGTGDWIELAWISKNHDYFLVLVSSSNYKLHAGNTTCTLDINRDRQIFTYNAKNIANFIQ